MAFTFDLSPLDSIGSGERSTNRSSGNAETQTLVYKVVFDGTQSDGDIIPLDVVYGNDIFIEGAYWNDALTGMADVNIGLYNLDGTDADENFFADAEDLTSAQDTPFGDNAMSEAGVIAQGDRSTPLGDLSSALDTTSQYVLALTLVDAGTATGVLELKFVVNRAN